MMLAPGSDLVEIVAGADGGAGHQQQHLVEPVHDPLRLTIVRKLGKVLQQQGRTRTRNLLAGKPKCQPSIAVLPTESQHPANHIRTSTQNGPKIPVNLDSQPWGTAAISLSIRSESTNVISPSAIQDRLRSGSHKIRAAVLRKVKT